jgi:hypothetical protein
MRQILWTMTPAAAEIRVTCIKALPRIPLCSGHDAIWFVGDGPETSDSLGKLKE